MSWILFGIFLVGLAEYLKDKEKNRPPERCKDFDMLRDFNFREQKDPKAEGRSHKGESSDKIL